ncbi:DUF4038 domain-containing protein [Nitrospira sp. BLG_1]|uniref:apiosidase-like domain-containing protein n=1 Tax=Nitrospira sp. BLG_1 TaxID=3395883 RepID=UPI0039BD3F08
MSEFGVRLKTIRKDRKKFVLGLNLVLVGIIFVGLSVICNVQGCSRDSSSPRVPVSSPPVAAPQPAFPLFVSTNHRYLQDQNGVPFPILGRTAWFITSLSEVEYKLFIDDTLAKGFNAIELHVINHDDRGNNEPFGGNAELPFMTTLDGHLWNGSLFYHDITKEAPDFSLPNEAYWRHIDAIVTYAESKGLLCFLFPAYAGNGGGAEGWMAEMTANGDTRMTIYGSFIANRYKTQRNIVWMLGGDYGSFVRPGELDAELAMLKGIQSVQGQSKNISAEWSSESIYTDQADPELRAVGSLQGAYSFRGDVNTFAQKGYKFFPEMPTFLLEEPYDQEGPDGNEANPLYAIQPVRRFQWWGWLSGIGGYISGNGCVWPFNPPKLLSISFCSDGWQAHLNTQGAQDMARLNAFVRSIAWHNLVPSGLGGMKTIVTAGGSQPNLPDYIAAAASPDGTLMVAYVPPDHSGAITIDLTTMSGQARARWFNPTTAVYTLIGTFANTGAQDFIPPGNNGTGFTDWVLLLEKQ